MNLNFFFNLPLRIRFRFTLGVVLIPLVVMALGSGIFLQHAADALNKIVEQPVYKLQTTSRLQNVIRQAHSSVKEHVNTGRYALRTQFDASAKAAEDTLVEILGKPLIFTVGMGLIIAIVGGVLLTRSVVVPLLEFEKGLEHFAHDDLSYRLNLSNQDELGRLARAFNSMAERLMKHQNKLQELSTHDGLTDLYNRREFDNRLREETLRARRYNKPFSVLMLDIDHFKNVNDRYGHQAGDEVLITVADLIRLNVRPVDSVCRYGGEELTVILPETSGDGARILSERIRATIEESLTATPQGDVIRVTVSIGIATFPHDADTGAALVNAADRALYAAKQDGRNLVRSCLNNNT
ncbi:MAG: diguanylate cyclase [Gammaproteobacteria bacterium]|nr:diguanylate cyclase [Gammaproteobacteria bacterium]